MKLPGIKEKTVEVLVAPKERCEIYLFALPSGAYISTKLGPIVAPSLARAREVLDTLLNQYGNIPIRIVHMVEEVLQ